MTRAKTRSKRTRETSNHHEPPSLTSISQTLISAIRASQGSKLPSLKNLYGLLVHLSRDSENQWYSLCEFVMNSDGRENVGEVLFGELEFRFGKFFSALCDVSSASSDDGPAICVDELVPLLRCCMVVLTLADPDVLFEKARILLRILGRAISFVHRGDINRSITLEKRVSREFSYRGEACTASVSEDYVAMLSITEPSDQCAPFLCVVLEVFADELLMHRMLRELLMRVVASSTGSLHFPCDFHNGAIESVLEVISLQFILSLSVEEGFENFLSRLSCRVCDDLRVCEISLTSSLSLLLNPTILSAPEILQAHLMLLVSEAIGVSMSENVQSCMSLMGTAYLTTFERSVVLYNGFMSKFLWEGHPIGWKALCSNPQLFERSFEPSFESHIQEKTRAKLDDIAARSVSSWNSQSRKAYDKTRSNLLADSIACVDECRVDESCKVDILVILNSIVLGAFSDSVSDDLLYKKDETSLQDVYLLAALLKLISSSMSAVIRCLRLGDENLVRLGEASTSSHDDYDFIANIIGCFQHFNLSLPNQKKLFDMMKSNPIRHKTTKWMLLHISGLLSLSFASGFDFLVENCVSILIALMNLYVFEEGNVEGLLSVLVPGSKPFSSRATLDKPEEAIAHQKISQKIAARIQKTRSVFLSSEAERVETSYGASILKYSAESNEHIDEETEETCDGKVYLDCLLKRSADLPDYDDLADFVECKAGKDYSSWLKHKERHRRWRFKKMEVVRLKKMKKTWKLVSANESWLTN